MKLELDSKGIKIQINKKDEVVMAYEIIRVRQYEVEIHKVHGESLKTFSEDKSM